MKRALTSRATLGVSFVVAAGIVLALLHGCAGDDSAAGTLLPQAQEPSTQIDRMGNPAINTVLIPSSQKNSFNQGDPSTDRARFLETVRRTIVSIRTSVGAVPGFPPEDAPGIDAATLAGVLIPDVITVNLAQDVEFPNGRRLEDDVIDAELGLVLNRGGVLAGGPGVSDGVANDSQFLPAFPYLGAPR
jgi:hypothetical protein